MGPATTFLKKQASTDLFKQATGNSLRSDYYARQRVRESFLRISIFLPLDSYKGEMDEFLAAALSRMNYSFLNRVSILSLLSSAPRSRIISTCSGEHAFRKHEPSQLRRSIVNASLWDVMSTSLARVPEEQVRERARKSSAIDSTLS